MELRHHPKAARLGLERLNSSPAEQLRVDSPKLLAESSGLCRRRVDGLPNFPDLLNRVAQLLLAAGEAGVN